MTEKHIGKVVQVTGPVLDIRFREGELPALLNAIEIDVNGHRLVAEVAQQVGDDVVRCIAMSVTDALFRIGFHRKIYIGRIKAIPSVGQPYSGTP